VTKRSQAPRCISIPKNLAGALQAAFIFGNHKWTFKYDKDVLYFIVSKILKMNKNRYEGLRLVPVYSVILAYEVGRHYREYLDFLIENGILITDNHYVVSNPIDVGKCKYYGIGNNIDMYNTEVYWVKKASLLKKMARLDRDFGEERSDEMVSLFIETLPKVTVDKAAAYETLERMQKVNPKKFTKEKIQGEKRKIDEIEKAVIYVKKDQYGRIHTNFTSVCKEVRENHLYYEGKKLVGVDIVSSQPAMLSCVFRDYLELLKLEQAKWGDTEYQAMHMGDIVGDIIDARYKYVAASKPNYITEPHVDGSKFEFRISRLGESSLSATINKLELEIVKYEKWIREGIYEHFVEMWRYLNRDTVSRDEMKRKWVTYVFGSPSRLSKKMKTVWESEFPIIDKLLTKFKIKNFRSLAHQMQKIESTLMYTKVCTRVRDKGIFFATVHDSVIVTEDMIEIVKQDFSEVLISENIPTRVK
jgi:hypothetical protein